jgi:hypothetical protein
MKRKKYDKQEKSLSELIKYIDEVRCQIIQKLRN